MKGIVYTNFGPPEVLQVQEIQKPSPKANQLLVQVKASSINITDYLRFIQPMATGKTPWYIRLMDRVLLRAIHKVPGCDIAGTVVAAGDKVSKFKIGGEVYGMTPQFLGGWAEYACINEKDLYSKPTNVSFAAASAVPVVGITALAAVRKSGNKAGQKVLVQGATGGVGHFVLQLAKEKGAIVTAVCSSRNAAMVKNLGADQVIDYKKEDFAAENKKFDVIIGVNGYRSLTTYLNSLADGGTYLVVGGMKQALLHALGGPIRSIGRGKRMTGVAFPLIKDKGIDELNELMKRERIKPYIDHVYPAEKAPDAIEYIIDEHAQGKVVICLTFKEHK